MGYRIGYSDGSYDGTPISANKAIVDKVYGATASGVKFTTPANATLTVASMAVFGDFVGSPVGNPRLRIYTGATPSLQGTSNSMPAGALKQAIHGGVWWKAFFSPSLTIAPGTVVRATLENDGSSDSLSAYWGLREFVWDSDAGSQGLLPFEGTWQKTYFNGTTWTDNATSSVFAVMLGIDTTVW
jgi:hypothetical protein